MRADLVEQSEMCAFADQKIICWPEHRSERIRIGHPPFVDAVGTAITQRLARRIERPFKQTARIDPRQCAQRDPGQTERLSLRRPRQ